jgi:glycosyltransferase involved in cell wall biosynthesis
MNKTKVTVLMSVYNGARFLRDAVESILAQTMSDFEFIIIDDGSTDETADILASYRDSRLRIVHQPNQGLPAALNRGLRMARAELVARMDADDISLPKRLQHQYQHMLAHPQITVLACDALVIDEKGHLTGQCHRPARAHADILRDILEIRGRSLTHPAVIYRRSSILAINGYNERFRNSEDVDLWLRISAHGSLAALPQTLFHYREHQNTQSGTRRPQQLLYGLMARAAYLLRRDGVPDPTWACEEEWQRFVKMAEKVLLCHGLRQADSARIALRLELASHRDGCSVGSVLSMLLRDPRLARGLFIRHFYYRALRDIERLYLDSVASN